MIRIVAATLCAVVAIVATAAASIAGATVAVHVRVSHDGRAVRGAKVFLLGSTSHARAEDVTDVDGEVIFDDLPEDSYQVIVRAKQLEELKTTVTVRDGAANRFVVELSSEPKAIGRVRAATSTDAGFKTSLGDDSTIRKISPDLVDALSRLGGVTVGVSTSLASLSLRNKDPSATTTSFNGVSVNSSVVANALDRDYIAAAQVDQSRDAVDFLLLGPLPEPRYQIVESLGAFGASSTKITSQSTVGRMGLAAGATVRHAGAELDGRNYQDLSGSDYVHHGDFNGSSGFVRVGIPLPRSLALDIAYTAQRNDQEPIDSVFSASLPAGIGSNHTSRRSGYLASAAISGVLGATGFVVSTNVLGYGVSDPQPNRVVSGFPAPTDAEGRGKSSTVQLSFGIPLSDRHAVNGLARVEASQEEQTSTAGPFSTASRSSYVRSSYELSHRWHPYSALSFNTGFGASRAAGGKAYTGFYEDVTVRSARDSYLLSLSSKTKLGEQITRAGLTDPDTATFDCSARSVVVTGLSDASSDTASAGVSLSWRRKLRSGSVAVSAYDQQYSGVTLNDALIPANASGLPGAYLQQLADAYTRIGGCSGSPAIYAGESLAGQSVLYRGMNVRAVRNISRRLYVEAAYDLQAAVLGGSDRRLAGSRSAFVPGAQVPNAPLHSFTFTVDQLIGSRTELLTNVQAIDSNNARNLPKYALTTMALSSKLSNGLELNVIYSNVGDRFVSPYISSRYAVPLATAGGPPLGTLAAPLVRSSLTIQLRYRLDHSAPLF